VEDHLRKHDGALEKVESMALAVSAAMDSLGGVVEKNSGHVVSWSTVLRKMDGSQSARLFDDDHRRPQEAGHGRDPVQKGVAPEFDGGSIHFGSMLEGVKDELARAMQIISSLQKGSQILTEKTTDLEKEMRAVKAEKKQKGRQPTRRGPSKMSSKIFEDQGDDAGEEGGGGGITASDLRKLGDDLYSSLTADLKREIALLQATVSRRSPVGSMQTTDPHEETRRGLLPMVKPAPERRH